MLPRHSCPASSERKLMPLPSLRTTRSVRRTSRSRAISTHGSSVCKKGFDPSSSFPESGSTWEKMNSNSVLYTSSASTRTTQMASSSIWAIRKLRPQVQEPSITSPSLPPMLRNFWVTLRRQGCTWRDRTVPSIGLHQVFVEDPSEVTIEMNFPASGVASIELPTDPAIGQAQGADR